MRRGREVCAALLVLASGPAILAVGCLEPETTVCGSGLVCPAGTVCRTLEGTGTTLCLHTEDRYCEFQDPAVEQPCAAGMVCYGAGRICVSLQQFQACAGRAEGEHCLLLGFAPATPLECRRQVCVLPLCGDGVLDEGEACDDFNSVAGDGCSPDCAVETHWACRYSDEEGRSVCTDTCGDGVINGVEECDGPDLGGVTCADLGYNFGEVFCTPACALDTGACSQAVEIPAGTFTMGSPEGEAGRYENETQHEVTLTRPFLLQATEITQRQFEAVMGYNPSAWRSCGPNCPVDNVSWHEVALYLVRLSEAAGLEPCYTCSDVQRGSEPEVVCQAIGSPYECPGYRLPTEAEWEYAARAGDQRATYNGDLDDGHPSCEEPNPVLDPVGWFCGDSGYVPHPVGELQPNAWGLYDMLGNVWEWTHDVAFSYPTTSQTDPYYSAGGSVRVFRGGCWFSNARVTRAAFRGTVVPSDRVFDRGARPARSVSP